MPAENPIQAAANQARALGIAPATAPAPSPESPGEFNLEEFDAAMPATPTTSVSPKNAPPLSSSIADSMLADLGRSISASNVKIEERQATFERDQHTGEVAAVTIEDSLRTMNTAKELAARTTANADLQAQNILIDADQTAGGPLMRAHNLVILDQEASEVERLLNQQNDNLDNTPTGIGIIDAVINQFTNASTAQQITAAEADYNFTSRRISNNAAALTATNTANSLTRRTLTAGVIEANSNAIKAQGDIEQAKAKITAVATNAQAMLIANQMDAVQVKAKQQLVDNVDAVRNREVAEQRLALNKAEYERKLKMGPITLETAQKQLEAISFQLSESKNLSASKQASLLAQRDEQIRQINLAQKARAETVTSIQAGQSAAGLPVQGDATILDQREIPGNKQLYAELHAVGSSPTNAFGGDPFSANKSLGIIDPHNQGADTKGRRLLRDITAATVKATTEVGAMQPKNEAEVKQLYLKTAAQVRAIAEGEIRDNDGANPFHAPPMSTLGQRRDVSSSLLWKKVLAPMAEGMPTVESQSIYDATLSALVAKTITPEEAARGLDTLFSAAADVNNTQDGGFARYGMKDQSTYNVKVKRPTSGFLDQSRQQGAMTRQRILEIINPLKVAKIITSGEGIPELEVPAFMFRSLDLMDYSAIVESLIQDMSAPSLVNSSAE